MSIGFTAQSIAPLPALRQRRLKREQAYDAIRAAIVRLEMPPASLIDETALGERLGLGRTPIREALQRLMHEGLVTIFPRRGMMVAPIGMLESQHLTQARFLWEPNVARLAAEVGPASAWEALERLLAASPATHVTPEEVLRGTEINGRFHLGIAQATGNPYLAELATQYQHRQARLSFLFFQHGMYDPVTAQHYEILAALRARDGDRAAALMEAHIQITRERQAKILQDPCNGAVLR